MARADIGASPQSHSKYVALMSVIVVVILAYLAHQAHMDVSCAADTYLSVTLVIAAPTAYDDIRVRIIPIDQYPNKAHSISSATVGRAYQARLLPCDCQPPPMSLQCILLA